MADVALQVPVGQPFNLNVLANDTAGEPAATIISASFDPALLACAGLTFDASTGVLSGIPTGVGVCPFAYVIQNTAGLSPAAVVLVIV